MNQRETPRRGPRGLGGLCVAWCLWALALAPAHANDQAAPATAHASTAHAPSETVVPALAAATQAALDAKGDPALEPKVTDLDWHDAARQRDVPVRLYWPSQVAPDAHVPLVVFSHGIGSSRTGYSYLGKHFAAHGIASLHLQHVGSDRKVWLGNPFGIISRLWDATSEREAVNRVRDLSFALDELLERSEYGGRVDRKRIAAAGHSYGANTVMLAAGATLQRNGVSVQYREPRIRAALLLSAPPFYGEPEMKKILGAITLPSLHITATEDVIRVPGYYSPAADRLAVFDAAGSKVKALVVFEGGSHNIFTDRPATGGLTLNPRVKSATQDLTLAFLRSVFDASDEGMKQWPGKHGALISRWVSLAP
jgi:predicted dienelactone hydrolase